MGNSVFWISHGGKGFLQVGFLTAVVDYLNIVIRCEQSPPKAGFVNPEWTENSDEQSWASNLMAGRGSDSGVPYSPHCCGDCCPAHDRGRDRGV